jgi:hypothetical protein
MAKTKKTSARKNINGVLEISINSVSNLLDYILKARAVLGSDRDLRMVLSPLSDMRGCVENLTEIVNLIEKEIRGTMPKREARPTGLQPTAVDLRKFDPDYFDYTAQEYYQTNYGDDSFDTICYGLATWVFDDGETKAALHDVRKSFGEKVALQVRQNLKNRNHDT